MKIFALSVFAAISAHASDLVCQEGGFSVKSPVTLKESVYTSETVIPNSGGRSMKAANHFFDGSAGGFEYMVGYCDFPDWVLSMSDRETTINAVLDAAGESTAKLLNGKLIFQTKITIAGYPGREAMADAVNNGQPILIKAHYLFVGKRLYQVIVAAPAGKGVSEIESFLGSFSLLRQ